MSHRRFLRIYEKTAAPSPDAVQIINRPCYAVLAAIVGKSVDELFAWHAAQGVRVHLVEGLGARS